MPKSLLRIIVIGAALFAALPAAVYATNIDLSVTSVSSSSVTVLSDDHWTNSSGGNWSTGSNWSLGSAPTSANNAIIDASGTYTVNLDVTPAFNSLTIGGGATGTQTLADTTTQDITFTNAGTITTSGVLSR